MHYFIAVTSHELPFSDIASGCNLLVSPTNLPSGFTYRGSKPLRALFIDSGAYHFNARRVPKDQRTALAEQIRVLKQLPVPERVAFFHCDVLPRDGISPRKAVECTLANAVTFAAIPVDPPIEKIGVAQARTPEEMYFVVRFLRDLGYPRIGLGGLAKLHRRNRSLLAEMVEAAVEAVDEVPLHSLGVTAPHVMPVLKRNGVASCDSATPIWSAIYGSLLYSRPLRRYRLASVKSERPGIEPDTGYYRRLKEPLPCSCPVCQRDPLLLTGTGPLGKHYRTIHNYLHLRAEVEGGGMWRKVSLSADSLYDFMKSNASAITSEPLTK